MFVLLLLFLIICLYFFSYFVYGRWLSGRVFGLSSKNVVPSVIKEDGVDFVPSSRFVVFGHHFTSIAGTGPIVGPAIAVIWGWVPALLWVLLGSILIGAVHDFASLVISLRNEGKSIGEIAGGVLNGRVRVLFLFILFLALTIVLAIFGLVIAGVFRAYPQAIFACLVQIPLALLVGFLIKRKRGGLFLSSLLVLGLMYFFIYISDVSFIKSINSYLAGLPSFTWVFVLLIYSYFASILPVWSLLQPRDFINSLQLVSVLLLLVLGLCVSALSGFLVEGSVKLEIVAPMFRFDVVDAPPIFPFLFIIMACGAFSGFHCLVSSGMSSKQLSSEMDAQFVGYGGMLTEGFLAVIVIFSCVAGLGLGFMGSSGELLTGVDAYMGKYKDFSSVNSLSAKVSAFVEGSANFLQSLGFSKIFSVSLMGVFVASFAGTTLDSACRLQRYIIQELFGGGLFSKKVLRPLRNKYVATGIAVVFAMILAGLPIGVESAGEGLWSALQDGSVWVWLNENGGKGGLILWPLFGATNQLLGGLTFIVIFFWLWRKGLPIVFIFLPMIFMLFMPAYAMILDIFVGEDAWLRNLDKKLPLLLFGISILLLELWMLIECFFVWLKLRKVNY